MAVRLLATASSCDQVTLDRPQRAPGTVSRGVTLLIVGRAIALVSSFIGEEIGGGVIRGPTRYAEREAGFVRFPLLLYGQFDDSIAASRPRGRQSLCRERSQDVHSRKIRLMSGRGDRVEEYQPNQ